MCSVVLEWKQTTRSTTVEPGASPEDGVYMQREVFFSFRFLVGHGCLALRQVKTRAAVSPIVSEPGTQMKLKSLRCSVAGNVVYVFVSDTCDKVCMGR